jgi:hypothetical protein
MLPGGVMSRPFGTSMPGKTNVLIGCIGPFKTRPNAAAAMEEGIKLAMADAAKTLGPNVNLLLECVDSSGDAAMAAAAMRYLVGKKAGEPKCLWLCECNSSLPVLDATHAAAGLASNITRTARCRNPTLCVLSSPPS